MKIELSKEDKADLEKRHRAERDGRIRDRIKAVLLFAEDWTGEVTIVHGAVAKGDNKVRIAYKAKSRFRYINMGLLGLLYIATDSGIYLAKVESEYYITCDPETGKLYTEGGGGGPDKDVAAYAVVKSDPVYDEENQTSHFARVETTVDIGWTATISYNAGLSAQGGASGEGVNASGGISAGSSVSHPGDKNFSFHWVSTYVCRCR